MEEILGERKLKVKYVLAIAFAWILLGTVAFHLFEGWDFVDSLYFSTSTLTTVGYGDLFPTTQVSKLFAVFYMFSGVAIMFYALSQAGAYYVETRMHDQIIKTLSPRENFRVIKRSARSMMSSRKKKEKH
ncbi:MAG: potassium channel family protein [Candidatus Micrarchaeota archaeon]